MALKKELNKLKKQIISAFKTSADHDIYFSDISLAEYSNILDHMMKESVENVNVWGEEESWMEQYNRTPLHSAAFFGKIYGVKLTLCEKASLSYNKKDDFGFTPMDYAEQQGHIEIVKLLKEFEEKRVKNK